MNPKNVTIVRNLAGIVAATVASQAALAQDAPKELIITGYLDAYGQLRVGNDATTNITGRQYDARAKNIRIAAAQLHIEYRPKNAPFYLVYEPLAGDNADTLYYSEYSRNAFAKYSAQAYAGYKLPDGTTLEFGKFYTWIGYEGSDSATNDNYSRGSLFFFVQPIYHGGFRASKELSSKLGVTVAVVGSWNSLKDTSSGSTIGGQLRYALAPGTSATLGFISGKEGATKVNDAGGFGGIGFANAGSSQVDLIDAIIVRESGKWKIALNADYAQSGGTNKGKFYGIAGYARLALTPKVDVAARLEGIQDPDGVRTGGGTSITSATFTADYKVYKGTKVRFEFRHDESNRAIFAEKNGTDKKQDTVSVSLSYRW